MNYADDCAICCRDRADGAMARMRDMMGRLKRTVNEQETRPRRLPEEAFDFLGYTFGRCYSLRTGRLYLGPKPSPEKVSLQCGEISELPRRTSTALNESDRVTRPNRKPRGWSNYSRLGTIWRSYRKIDQHAQTRLRHWLCIKTDRQRTGVGVYPNQILYNQLGPVRLTGGRRQDSPKTPRGV